MVVNVQFGIERDQLHVRFVQSVDVAHVAPIILCARLDIVKGVGEYSEARNGRRNDVAAEVVIRRLAGRILGQQFLEPVHGDHIDTHRGAREIFMADDGIG